MSASRGAPFKLPSIFMARLGSFLALGVLSALLAAGCGSVAPRPQGPIDPPSPAAGEIPTLAPATTRDVEVGANLPWRGALSVAVESYLQLAVAQRNVDVAIDVLDATGRRVAGVDGRGGVGSDERLAARLAPGEHVLRLLAKSERTDGLARLSIEALRPFGPGDEQRLSLVRVGQEATDLDGSTARHDWERARELSLEELAGWRSLGDREAIVRTLNRLASLERELGELDLSIARGEEALASSLAADDAAGEAASRYWLGQSLNRAGRVDESEAMFALGLAAAERAGDLALQGRLVNWQGRLCRRRGELDEARRLYERALELRLAAHDEGGVSSIQNNLGVLAHEMGDFAAALDYYERAIAQALRLARPGDALLARANLANLLAWRGQWQEALESLTEGLEVARATDDRRRESILGTDLAYLQLALGELAPARALFLRSLELDTERRDGFSRANALLGLAQVERGLGELGRAGEMLQEAYDLAAREELSAQRHRAVRGLARVELEQQRPREARDRLAALLADPELGLRPTQRAGVLKDLAEAHLQLAEVATAQSYLDAALGALGGLPLPEIRFDIAFLAARASHAAGDEIAAVREAELALDMAESMRLSIDDPDLRATFLSRSRQAYDFTIARLLELDRQQPEAGFAERAFTTLERGRARSLAEMLARARFGAEQALDPAELEAERAALAVETSARVSLARAVDAGQAEDLAKLAADLDAARRGRADAENELRRTAPRYATLLYDPGSSVETVQRLLPPGTVLVEYSLQPERSVAFVVRHDGFDAVELAPEPVIAERAASFRAALARPSRGTYGALQRDALGLGDLLIAPLEETLAGARHLVFVPDGELAYIPFESLRLRGPKPGEDRFLVERWATSYAPSASVFRTLIEEAGATNGRAAPGRRLVAFADPRPPAAPAAVVPGPATASWPRLPGARREVAAIAGALLPGQALTWLDAEADEHTLKSRPEISTARWIHFASHALIDERTPANSAIVLAPGPDEDGYLTVQEVFALELAADLVVLSGCETALGRQVRGEGLLGLTRAFLYAGARGLQVSLWKVDDDTTPELMSSFYASLSRGVGAAEALRAAKLASLDDPRRSHPFHWAPFVLIGG